MQQGSAAEKASPTAKPYNITLTPVLERGINPFGIWPKFMRESMRLSMRVCYASTAAVSNAS